MGFSDKTKRYLLSSCGNKCAFPGCDEQIFDIKLRSFIGEICHIKGNKKGSARYDPNQLEEERQSYDNGIVMCGIHAKVIDSSLEVDKYTVELLTQWKHEHERETPSIALSDFIQYMNPSEKSLYKRGFSLETKPILPKGHSFRLSISLLDHLKRRISTKDKSILRILGTSPAVKEIVSFPTYIEIKLHLDRQQKLYKRKDQIPFLIHQSNINTKGKITFIGEIQPLQYTMRNTLPTTSSIDLTSVSYIIIDSILFSYRIFRLQDFKGLISVKFDIIFQYDTRGMKISFFNNFPRNYPYDCELISKKDSLTIQIQDSVDEDPTSALRLSNQLVNKFSHTYGFINFKINEVLLTNFILRDIVNYHTVYPLSGSWFDDLNLKIDYSQPISKQIEIFKTTGNYVNSEELKAFEQVKSVIQTFETDNSGSIVKINMDSGRYGFPEEVCKLIHLEEIVSTNCGVKELPESIGNLKALKSLTLSYNHLSTLPQTFSKLRKLHQLTLFKNNFKKIPEEIRFLTDLEHLDLANNKIEDIPSWIGILVQLHTFYLSNNKLSLLPPQIGKLIELRKMDLSGNQFTGFPKPILNFTNLTELAIGDIPIDQEVKNLNVYHHLRMLWANNCGLNHISEESLSNFKQLVLLDLKNNPLTEKTLSSIRKNGFSNGDGNLFFTRS